MGAKKNETLMSYFVEDTTKNLSCIKSLVAFRENAKRQWGNIAETLFDTKGLSAAFRKIINESRKLNGYLSELRRLRSRNAISSCIEDITYALDNIKIFISELSDIVTKSDIFNRPIFADAKILNENGKRLGLKILIQRSNSSIKEIERTVTKLTLLNERNVLNVTIC